MFEAWFQNVWTQGDAEYCLQRGCWLKFLALVKYYSGDKIMENETGNAQQYELKSQLTKYETPRSTAEIENLML